MTETILRSHGDNARLMVELRELLGQGLTVYVEYSTEKQKTPSQRSALHVWLEELAEVLNASGLDMKKVLKPEVEIPWTKLSCKEYLYKPLLEAMTGKESTESMNTLEPSKVCDVIGRHLAQKFGVAVPPFPNRFNDG